MKRNNNRFDLSDRLIHFFRDVDAESQSTPAFPDHFAFNNFVEDTRYPAIFLLRTAIRMQTLWATWSMRKGVRTIYGPYPVVCFTEMPLAAFLESSKARESRGEAMSSYGLTFRKGALFAKGANPVIYGLTDRRRTLPAGSGGGPRLLSDDMLPQLEQYRYVTYSPIADRPIDWTHEREWRWPFTGDMTKYEAELDEFGIVSDAAKVPSLSIGAPGLDGIGVIVKTRQEAEWVAHDILTLIDRKLVDRDHFHHILEVSALPPSDVLYSPESVRDATDAATISFDDYFDYPAKEVHQAESEFSAWVRQVEAAETRYKGPDGSGGCWLWIPEGTHQFVRKLVQAERVIVNKEGRYLAKLTDFEQTRPLENRYTMAESVGKLMKKRYGIESTYFATPCSIDPDDVPFNIGWDFLECRSFYNRD